MEDAVEPTENIVTKKEGEKLPQYIAALVVTITSFVHGAGIGWLSPFLPILQSETSPVGRRVSDEEGSWLGANFCLGAIIGTLLYLMISNRYSRKVTGYLVAVPYIIAYAMIPFSSTVTALYIARIFAGIGTAATTVFCPMYVTEISEDSVRGTLGSFYVLICGFGVLAVYVFGGYTSYYATCHILLSIMFLYLLAFYFIPESPVYLVSQTNLLGAEKSLKWLRGSDADVLERELFKLTSSMEKKQEKTSLKEMLRKRSTRMALAVSVLLVTNLQLSAPIAILSYTVTIFKDAGSDLSPNMSSIIVAILQIVGNLLATVLLDKVGRKMLLIASNLFLTVSLCGLGAYFYCKLNGIDVTSITWLPLLCLSTYIVSLSIGISPVPFVMIPELFMPEARDMAILISMTLMWFLGFLVTKLFTNISEMFGLYGCYWVLASSCFAGLLLSIFVFPETKNKSIETIVDELNSSRRTKFRNRIR